jgi:hypothetical protein
MASSQWAGRPWTGLDELSPGPARGQQALWPGLRPAERRPRGRLPVGAMAGRSIGSRGGPGGP